MIFYETDYLPKMEIFLDLSLSCKYINVNKARRKVFTHFYEE